MHFQAAYLSAADITRALNNPITKDDVPSEYLFEEIQEEKAGLFSKKALAEKGCISEDDIASLLALFENAKTFGSLIQVPPTLAAKLPEIGRRLNEVMKYGDLTHASARVIWSLILQAQQLHGSYGNVVTNPPYLGTKGMNTILKGHGNSHYPRGKADLYAMFTERCSVFAGEHGHVGLTQL